MVLIQVQLCLHDVLELQVAFGETGMCLHLLELEGVLVVLLLHALVSLSGEFLLDGLLEPGEVLFLILHTSVEFTLQVVELSDFMRYPRLAFLLSCSLRDCQSTLIGFEGVYHIDFDQFLSFFDVNLHQLLANQPHHLTPLLLRLQSACVVKGVLEYLNGAVSFLPLIVALSQSQQGHEFELPILDNIRLALQELASSTTF